jgi:hypothetical protein
MSAESDFQCERCGFVWCAIPPTDCPECRAKWKAAVTIEVARMRKAKKTEGQCQCCASPLGDTIKLKHTERVICSDCLGFMARWLVELEQEPPQPGEEES